jgi:hypothetical protein
MHAQLRPERQAEHRLPRTPPVGSSVPAAPVRGRPCEADGPSHRSQAPLPVRYASVDPQRNGLRRDKVTHAGTEKKRPASARIRS